MTHRPALVLVALVLILPGLAAAQAPPDRGTTSRTRQELERQLAEFESALVSSSYSDREKDLIRFNAEEVRNRLQYGDFRVGDRIILSVQGESLPDTVTVDPGQVITLPLFGEIPVGGVLRSEITAHLTTAFSSFIRDPVVRAIPLMRVSVVGSVGDPGFYTMPAETVLGEALMVAGGPLQNANLEKVRLFRGTEQLMQDDQVQTALQAGLTLDQLNLVGGDQIQVPERRGILRTLTIVTSVMGSLSFLVWIFLR